MLTVYVSPANTGVVKVDGTAASSYPVGYTYSLYSYTTVNLEAVPAAGYKFTGWTVTGSTGSETVTENPTSLIMNCDKTVTASFTPAVIIHKFYFPHVASFGSTPADKWETEICVINTGSQTVTGKLKSYRDNGQAASSDVAVTLPAHGRWSRIVGGGAFSNPSQIRHMVFEANDSENIAGYAKFYINGVYRTAIPAVKEEDINTTDIYVTHIASDADWWTGLSLVNTTSATKQLTIAFNNGQSRSVTLNANEHTAFNIAQEFFNNQPQPDIQSAVIANADGIIGLELFGSLGWGAQLEGILLTDQTASTIYYPHVADGDYWWTGIVAYNPSDSAGTITITPYDAQGTLLTTSKRSIAGKEKYVGAVAQLGLPDQTAWFRIDSSMRPLNGFELFGAADGSQLAAYAGGIGTGVKAGVFPKIEKSGWTGIAFVNTSALAANVTLTAYNDNGGVVATQKLTVGGHAKVVDSPEDLFSQGIGIATYIAFSSDRNIVGFQLNGSADGKMLDCLPGL